MWSLRIATSNALLSTPTSGALGAGGMVPTESKRCDVVAVETRSLEDHAPLLNPKGFSSTSALHTSCLRPTKCPAMKQSEAAIQHTQDTQCEAPMMNDEVASLKEGTRGLE